MWTRFIKKYSASIRCAGESGQAILEYLLVLIVVLGIFVTILRPEIGNLKQKLTGQFAEGMFAAGESGDGFYSFRVR